jgi:hypothetical protein
MIWNKPSILAALKKLGKQDKDLSYNGLSKSNQSLVSAAAYHFGSYRAAIEAAGIDYADVTRRPRWTKQRIISLIKDARRGGNDLHWSAATQRRDDLGRAAFASLQPRLFGSWDRALHAAGLDADEISRYRNWNKNSIVFELKALHSNGEAMNSGALQHDDPGLHAAAVRHFGSYEKALKAAHIDSSTVRRRRSWTKQQVLAELKSLARTNKTLSDSVLRKENPALYGASLRLFGTFTAARAAAGIKTKSRK